MRRLVWMVLAACGGGVPTDGASPASPSVEPEVRAASAIETSTVRAPRLELVATTVIDPGDAMDALERAELLELVSQRFGVCPPAPGGDAPQVELFVGLGPGAEEGVAEASVGLLSGDGPNLARWSCAVAAANGSSIERGSEALLPVEQWTVALRD